METKEIQISDYNYPLPDERIAKFPLPERDSSKLLVYRHGEVSHTSFRSLPSLLPEGALMVFNNTRVIQARLHFRKDSAAGQPQGALIEVFLLEPALPVEYQENFSARGHCRWHCMIGNLKKWKEGELHRTVCVGGQEIVLSATRQVQAGGTSHLVDFRWDGQATWAELLDAIGELPIPPYLNRPTEASDLVTYQTVYSRIKGSVAAPTAGLHFTEKVLADIDSRGIERREVTLHVGAGTFKPVKSQNIGGHDMHTEHISVNRSVLQALLDHHAEAIAVGTTSVRTLESLYYMGIRAHRLMQAGTDTGEGEELHVVQWEPYGSEAPEPSSQDAIGWLLCYMDRHGLDVLHSSTQIIIAPGYSYHIVKMMVTNFHQPQSTLLLLVSAFVKGDWKRIYDYALNHGFRFLSYGDSSLLIP
ncbi:MAG: S-adenosylmethionine:tRNA ribosyltransferase-isomerase [Bacteroidaceae bacterium]